ncbi:unnamed protein product, partial [Chrysoparadoxa australica]
MVFKCREGCDKTFPARSKRDAHERVHTGEKPFQCDTCLKRFTQRAYLKSHPCH